MRMAATAGSTVRPRPVIRSGASAGCATLRAAETPSTEEFLSAAGFHPEAVTPSSSGSGWMAWIGS